MKVILLMNGAQLLKLYAKRAYVVSRALNKTKELSPGFVREGLLVAKVIPEDL